MAITKNILVTGAGSGIGRAIAQHLSKNNYDLILLSRNPDHLEETRNSLECPHHPPMPQRHNPHKAQLKAFQETVSESTLPALMVIPFI